MNVTAAEIERMVRDVLSRMTAAAPAPNPTAALELANRVITLDDVDGRLAEINQLIVAPKAVVTPAVRDVLRQRKISLVRRAAGGKADPVAKHSIAVAVAASKFDSSRLVDDLRRDGYGVQQLAQAGTVSAVRELADGAARGGVRSLLLADQTEAALIAANRYGGVRAVGGDDPQQVAQASAAVDANFLVVRPSGKSDYLLRRIVAAWLAARANVSNELLELLK